MKLLIPILLLLSGCGIQKSMDNISGNMDSLNGKLGSMSTDINGMNTAMGGMSKGVHSQSLMLALNEILKSENTRYITLTSVSTVPMGAAAQAFADIATADEIAGIAFLWISEINLSQVDGATKAQKDANDLAKYIKLNALQMIAGLIPEKTMNELYKTQIISGGIYESATYGLIALRYGFIKDFMVEQYLSMPLTNPSQYESVLTQLEYMSSILKLPFKGNCSLKLYGFADTQKLGLNQTISIDNTNVCSYYTKLKIKFDKELDKNKYNNLTKRLNDIKIKLESCKG